MATKPADGTLTVAEAAARLGVSQQTARRWIKAGRLPAHRVGPRQVRVRVADLVCMVGDIASTETEVRLSTREEALAFRLSPEEIERRLAVLERLKARRQQVLDARGGVPFDDSTEIIRTMREERDQQLGYS